MMHVQYLDVLALVCMESNKYTGIMLNTTIEIFGCNYTWRTLMREPCIDMWGMMFKFAPTYRR